MNYQVAELYLDQNFQTGENFFKQTGSKREFQEEIFTSQIENQDFLADQIGDYNSGFGQIAPELMQFKENWSFDKKQRNIRTYKSNIR